MTSAAQGTDRYRAPLAEQPELMRSAPIAINGLASEDWAAYRRYVDHSCDLTMRGGTTSGVVYPLAVCALAEHYVFRSIGGASAGAIAASATAAAELGRTAEPVGEPTKLSVRPGFDGLQDLVTWLTRSDRDGREDWRLAQLFQPGAATRRLFRVAAASMQSRGSRGTGKSKLRCMTVALLAMLGPFSLFAILVTMAVWLAGPTLAALLPPSRWGAWPTWIQWAAVALALVAVIGLGSSLIHGASTARRAAEQTRKPELDGTTAKPKLSPASPLVAGAAAAVPLLAGLTVFIVRSVMHQGVHWPSLAWWATASLLVVLWLVLTLSAAGVFTVVLGLGASHFLTRHAKEVNFGLVAGLTAPKRGFLGRLIDRAAGMPKPTGVPGLSVWLADRIDDLAGIPYETAGTDRKALTFGDLWRGSLIDGGEDLQERSADRRRRVINLELMTTNLSQGRPYRLPFMDNQEAALLSGTSWLFCAPCLDVVLPARVVRQLVAAAPAGPAPGTCERHHTVALRNLPEPWNIPVILATRMSLSLPGLICAVPLYSPATPEAGQTTPLQQWFSDGGITSNFPIHFFDSLLPRWPTFGLNLQQYPPGPGQRGVYIPPQDTTASTEAWTPVGSAFGFAGSILETFLSWRDTMQSALPGFRGRIAHIRQAPWEGGSNLFMRRDTIQGLAERGRQAGVDLRDRFTGPDCAVVDGQTQTDRYRWIRMRLAMRKYGELAHEMDAGAQLFRLLALKYQVPPELGAWFGQPDLQWPQPDPDGATVARAVDALAALTHEGSPLAERIAGAPPVNPNLRLTPRE